jgi:carboxyl-terminal processing protease
MHKKVSVGVAASLVLLAMAITFTATMILSLNYLNYRITPISGLRDISYNNITEIDKIVQNYYYEEPDEAAMYSGLVQGYISGLGDPYSVYLTAEQIAMREQEAKGTFVGVGIEIEKNEIGYFRIIGVSVDSPAAKSGIQAEDRITKINREDVTQMELDEAKALLNGTEGTEVILEVAGTADGKEETKEHTLAFAKLESVAVTGEVVEKIHYVKVSYLWDTAPSQYRRQLQEAEDKYEKGEIKGLVVDVRGVDTGHNLKVVADMLDFALPTGTLISGVYRGGEVKVLYTSDANSVTVPIVVLVNEKTTGYAEVFAAAMKDSDVCKGVVGMQTAGKGTLQQLMKLPDGSGVDISVALLKSPRGETFHGVGIAPDSKVPGGGDIIGDDKYKNDKQYQKAVDILNSR